MLYLIINLYVICYIYMLYDIFICYIHDIFIFKSYANVKKKNK